MCLIYELKQLLERLTPDQSLTLRWVIRELLQYLIPEWTTDPEKAIFPGRVLEYEVRISGRFTKKEGFRLTLSPRSIRQYSVFNLTILADITQKGVHIEVVYSPQTTYIGKYIDNTSYHSVSTHFNLSFEDLDKGYIQTKKLFDSIKELSDIREQIERMIKEFEKVK